MADLHLGAAKGEQGDQRGALRVALICALVAICDGLDTQSIAFVAPVLAKQWSVAPAAFGPVFSSGLAGLALGAFLFGSLADRIGRKVIILACVALFALASLATPLASNMIELAMWRALTGLGLGGVLPNLIAVTNEAANERLKNSMVMLMFCGFPLGATIGGMISAPLIQAFGWQSIFVVGGIAPLLLVPFLLAMLPANRPAQAKSAAGSFAQLFADGRSTATLLLWAAFFGNLLVMYFLVNWLPSLLSLIGSSLSAASMSTAMLNLGGIAGALCLARLIDSPKAISVLALAYLASSLALLLIAKAGDSSALMLVGATLAGSIVVGGQIALNAIAASLYPQAIRSTGIGWALGIGRIGSIIGPLVGGLLLGAGWTGTSTIVLAIIPALAVALALFALSRLHVRTQQAQTGD